jgi:peptidoglycan/LPS O-acetylase OafA/YrhL
VWIDVSNEIYAYYPTSDLPPSFDMTHVSKSGPIYEKKKSLLSPLTTFRFFAALAIVIFHAGKDERHAYLGTGVSFFFILSGFVLTYVHQRMDGSAAFVRFWVARWSRIWPLHFFTLIVVIIIQPFGHRPFKHFVSEFLLNISLLQCWVPVRRVAMSFNFVSWSLSVELFFYLVFPFLLPLVFKAPGRMLLSAVILYLLLAGSAPFCGIPEAAADGSVSYGAFLLWPILHLYEFVLGMAVCVWWLASGQKAKPVVKWSCLEILSFGGIFLAIPYVKTLSLFLVQGHTEYLMDRQLGDFFYAPLFAVLIYIFAFQAGVLSMFLSQAWLVYLGDISFSVYMIHCIVLSYFEKMPNSVAPQVKWVLFGLTVLLASGLLYAFLEKPARRVFIRLCDDCLKARREGGSRHSRQ